MNALSAMRDDLSVLRGRTVVLHESVKSEVRFVFPPRFFEENLSLCTPVMFLFSLMNIREGVLFGSGGIRLVPTHARIPPSNDFVSNYTLYDLVILLSLPPRITGCNDCPPFPEIYVRLSNDFISFKLAVQVCKS